MKTDGVTYHLIYLAAGYSRRFFGNKLLTEFKGKPLYRHGFDVLKDIVREGKYKCDLLVVTQYEAIVDELHKENVPVTINEDPSRGQSSSIQTGIHYLKEQGLLKAQDYMIFFTGDQPFLKRATVDAYLSELEEKQPLLAGFALNGKMRNPGAFKGSLAEEFFSLTGEMGGRGIFEAHKADIMPFTLFDVVELSDIDSREDLDEAAKK